MAAVFSGDPFTRLFWSRPSPLRRSPAADWIETAAAHIIKLDVPGFAKDDIKVEVEEGGVLRVAGEAREEAQPKEAVWHAAERGRNDFSRRFALPDGVRADHIKAQLDNGVLTVVVPKEPVQPKAKPRRDEIGVLSLVGSTHPVKRDEIREGEDEIRLGEWRSESVSARSEEKRSTEVEEGGVSVGARRQLPRRWGGLLRRSGEDFYGRWGDDVPSSSRSFARLRSFLARSRAWRW